MAKKVKKKAPAVEAPRPKDEVQDEDQYEEGMFRDDEPLPPPRQRYHSPSPEPEPEPEREPKLESPPSLPINGVSSPVLSALVDEEDAEFDTRAWARNIPYGLSPPNMDPSSRGSPANHPAFTGGLGTSPPGPAFSLAGSPPNIADRYRTTPSEDLRGGFGGVSPGIPPRGGFKARSKQGTDIPPSVSPRGRPLSMPTNYVPPTVAGQRPQPHFRGISEADIGTVPSRSTSGMRESQDLVLFDQAFYDGNLGDVILVGSGNELVIHKLERDKMSKLGTLSDLRGTIVAAKMLPPADGDVIEPVVAVVVHGPALSAEDSPHLSQNEAQTSVEVYAIKSSKHLATLYRTPPQPHNPYTRLTDASHAIGALAIQVAGRFITVTSGTSGEVYIFESKQTNDELEFYSLGKIWTSMPNNRQRSYSISSASSGATAARDESPSSPLVQEMGIVSLSQRWLAFVPPPASSQTTLRGEVGVGSSSNREPPGLMAHTPPAPSSANCEAETPLEEALWNKVARSGYQEAQKGAKWAAERGISAVKSYWGKPEAPSTDNNAQNGAYGQQAVAFPPTHAQDNVVRAKSAQVCISVVDLERLSESNKLRPDTMIHPIATFPVRSGCRYLSFNPTGLSLFAASAKGDVSYVWCLMRMVHGVIATPGGDQPAADSHASVRQIAIYTRMTESNLVDVVWTKPRGEKLAILTERGTIHIHDLPASAFRWPPPAHHTSPASTPGIGSETSSQQSQAKGRFGSAVSWMSNATQSVQAAVKTRPSFSGATLGGVAYAAGARGSRMMATGISKSVGAVSGLASNFVHSGENRTRLPGSSRARVVPGSVSLLSSKYQDALALTGTGLVRLHAIRLSVTDGGKGKRSVAGEQISQLSVPKTEGQNSNAGFDGYSVRGQWFGDIRSHGFRPNQVQPLPLSFAEIETSTPYRPFHNDRRVDMNTYADDQIFDKENLEDWDFGEEIETVEVGEEELPSGSMHLNKHEAGLSYDDNLDFDEESALPPAPDPVPAPAPVPAPKSSKAEKKSKKSRRAEPKHEDLIDVHDVEVDRGVPIKQTAKRDDFDDGIEDDGFPFGQNSEFGL